MRRLVLGALLAAVLAQPAHAADAVVGLIDTGINPYHQVFRDNSPRAYQHPSTYLPGYPADAQALPITLDAPDYETAVAEDCEMWKRVEPGKLYWFPGTKIVGAIAFIDKPQDIDCEKGAPTAAVILDTNGHGTMTASRATSTQYGACKACRVVSIHFPNDATAPVPMYQDALRWTAANRTWIDAQSNSWGPIAPGWEPTGQTGIWVSSPPLIRTVEATARVQEAFWASMNGAAGRGGVLGHPTELAPHLTPSVISVGGHDSGYVTNWTGFPPYLAADACNAWAAYYNKIEESDGTVSSGTSGATPYAAATAARILLDARTILGSSATGSRGDVMASGPAGLVPGGPLADGVFTRAEWRELFLKTASPRPEAQDEDAEPCLAPPYGITPVKWTDVPPDFPEYLIIGYGAADRKAVGVADQVLRGAAPMPDRKKTDDFFAQDSKVRQQLYAEFTEGQDEQSPAAVPVPPDTAAGGAGEIQTHNHDLELTSPGTASPGRRGTAARLGDIVTISCLKRSRARVTLRRGMRSASIRVGSSKARALKRRLTIKLPRRGRLTIDAVNATGQRLHAQRRFRRCADLRR